MEFVFQCEHHSWSFGGEADALGNAYCSRHILLLLWSNRWVEIWVSTREEPKVQRRKICSWKREDCRWNRLFNRSLHWYPSKCEWRWRVKLRNCKVCSFISTKCCTKYFDNKNRCTSIVYICMGCIPFWDNLSTLVRISWTSSANVLLCYLFHFPGSYFSHTLCLLTFANIGYMRRAIM